VLVEAVQRLINPPQIPSGGLLLFGVIGVVGNVASLLVLAGGSSPNFNLRAAFLEVVNDALGSAAVIVAGVVIALTGWTRADSIVALLVGALIVPRTLRLLKETIDVLLESTPRGLDLDELRAHLLRQPHVRSIHDLHATQVSSDLPILTAHVVVEEECFHDGHVPETLDALQRCVAEHFSVQLDHSTFQLEPPQHSEREAAAHT
jgi:cobalt-zinc-cadmium efflux system protein